MKKFILTLPLAVVCFMGCKKDKVDDIVENTVKLTQQERFKLIHQKRFKLIH